MTITTLTPEQRAAIPAHVQRWIKIGLSTAPMDRVRAAQAVLKLYELAELRAPRIEFAQSFGAMPRSVPKSGMRSRIREPVRCAVLDAVGTKVTDASWTLVRDAVLDAVWGAAGYTVRDAVRAAAWTAVYSGQYDAGACAAWRFCTDVLGVKVSADVRARLDAWCAIVESCGGVHWGRDVATIVDRPEAFERTSDGRIIAVVYRDGWKVQV